MAKALVMAKCITMSAFPNETRIGSIINGTSAEEAQLLSLLVKEFKFLIVGMECSHDEKFK